MIAVCRPKKCFPIASAGILCSGTTDSTAWLVDGLRNGSDGETNDQTETGTAAQGAGAAATAEAAPTRITVRSTPRTIWADGDPAIPTVCHSAQCRLGGLGGFAAADGICCAHSRPGRGGASTMDARPGCRSHQDHPGAGPERRLFDGRTGSPCDGWLRSANQASAVRTFPPENSLPAIRCRGRLVKRITVRTRRLEVAVAAVRTIFHRFTTSCSSAR